ncbi:PAAR domain-containing protein [Pseudomonas sp. MUP55]|uniref:PAAR domain-containing protein n=1 Tax=Pseudomonas sp. MUP55 TaxID=3087234 RepID=UPI002A5A4625|nr:MULTISPECIES: PAAR domain-containing protein [unclassified Pseudomonas]WPN94681.1 PAAR domain-containing protein [Pseudomonas sp. MUP56]WPO00208.1 PAAR domain-containing protein [Pseudomonas sp. MUP55]
MPETYIAQGSDKVRINSRPAARSGDKATCDATIRGTYLVESERPDGRIDRYDIDAAGQLTAYTDPVQRITRLHYDRSGRLIQRVDALGHTVAFGHDACGRLLHLSNENHERYRFEWDALDRLQAQHDLDGSGRIYLYNPLGEVTGICHVPAPLAEPDLDGKDSAEPHIPHAQVNTSTAL